MKFGLVIVVLILISCNQNAGPKEETITPAETTPKIQPEDAATATIRKAITPIIMQELQVGGGIKSMYIDSIRHEMISLKDFYSVKKEELSQSMKLSTDKEKTGKALAYLDKMKASSTATPIVYKIQYHLNAVLSNTVTYNENHTKYLDKDLKEIQLVFP